MSGVETYSADAVKRRKRRDNDDLCNYETLDMAEKLVKEAFSLIGHSLDCDIDTYNLSINFF